MAGIGFELKKLFKKRGLFASFRAYGYAGIVCTGPMLLGTLLLLGVLLLSSMTGASHNDRELLVCMITYALLASLIISGFFAMPVTRFIADMLYEEREENILSSFWGSTGIVLVIGCLLYGFFLVFSGISVFRQLICLGLFGELLVVWNAMSYLTAIRNYKGLLLSFLAAIVVTFGIGGLLLLAKISPIDSLLMAVSAGYGVMMIWDVILLHQFFPWHNTAPFLFLQWIDKYLPLALTGFLMNIGLFGHLMIMWGSPIGTAVAGLYYGAPYYDVPAFIAFLTILITTVNFVVSVEVNFYPTYRTYYSLFNGDGSIKNIMQAETEMLSVLNIELKYMAMKQLFMTTLAISLGGMLVERMPLGFNDMMQGYFRVLCVGYGMYAIANTMQMLLLYFTDYKGALLTASIFAGSTSVFTLISLFFDRIYFGFGFLLGGVVFFLAVFLRLNHICRSLPYYILSSQPIVAETKAGVFEKIGNYLQKNIKGSSMVMVLILAGMLQMSGCAFLSDEPGGTASASSAIENPQAVEKEERQSINDYQLRDKDLLYNKEEETSVVTMYLTVSKGNNPENTNHTWEEINTYSVFDYAEMGVPRYQIAALLQVGDQNGPQPDLPGYGETVPNATVQIRGQTSSKFQQKNYKIELKKGKGRWRNQRTINLNKHQHDRLRFRNKLAFDLMKGIPQMMSLRTQFVHLYVKDETAKEDSGFVDYGLYTQVEQLNKTGLEAHGLDSEGHLYKINVFEFYREEDIIMSENDPNFNLEAFEELLEAKGNRDHTKLIKMLEALNDTSIPMSDILEKYFDSENIAYWMAFHLLTGNTDTRNRNFYLYSPRNSEKWYIISWDNDGCFSTTETLLQNYVRSGSWERGVSNYWGNVLFERCLKSEAFRAELDKAVMDLMDYLSPERLKSMVDAYKAVVKPYVFQMPDAMHIGITPEEYEEIISGMLGEVDQNYQYYQDSLKKPMPFFIGVPVVVDGELEIGWDNAYDFDAEDVTYMVEVARDYTFQELLFHIEGALIPEIRMDLPEPGQYFVRVLAANSSGMEQDAFDYYTIDRGKVFGTLCFYVREDGTIELDVNVDD